MVAAALAAVQAQGGGGQDLGGGGDAVSVRALTPLEQFASYLKLDVAKQGPMIEQVMNDAAKEAAPVADQMLQIRQRWVNALLNAKPDDAKAASAAYVTAAANMTGIETRAFMRLYDPQKPNQQSGASKAFDVLAGFFQPASLRSGRGGARRGGGRSNISAAISAAVSPSAAPLAQRRGGGGAPSLGPIQQTRLDVIEAAFVLTKDQRKATKTLLDDAHKAAAPIREQLTKARAGIVAAIQGRQPQADIDAAVNAYAVQATSMTEAEMSALARLLQTLEKDQRANAGAVETTFFLMRNMFLDKKWDDVPGTKGY
jgi:hypothetical protein